MPQSKQNENQKEAPGGVTWLKRENQYLAKIIELQVKEIASLQSQLDLQQDRQPPEGHRFIYN